MRLALTAALLLVVTGCGSSDDTDAASGPSPSPSEVATFAAYGTLTVPGIKAESACIAKGGYDDVTGGAQVTVRDAAGKAVALGELGGGSLKDDGYDADDYDDVTCYFDFTVQKIPDGGDIYSVEVAHRGEVSFKRSEATSIAMKLG